MHRKSTEDADPDLVKSMNMQFQISPKMMPSQKHASLTLVHVARLRASASSLHEGHSERSLRSAFLRSTTSASGAFA